MEKTEIDSDYLYERERDDADIRKMEAVEYRYCEMCGLKYQESEMDMIDGKWLCRDCEESLEGGK